jgi:hypothetical protein
MQSSRIRNVWRHRALSLRWGFSFRSLPFGPPPLVPQRWYRAIGTGMRWLTSSSVRHSPDFVKRPHPVLRLLDDGG